MNAAVTGATGFLGGALLPRLAGRGWRVRALVRRAADEPGLRALGVEPVPGDLALPGGCGGLVRPGDLVVHAAARVDMCGTWRAFHDTTVAGTRHLLAAALPQRPARVVYVSSAGVYLGPGARSPVSAERTPARPWAYNHYARAKLAAEELVRVGCAAAGCPWTIVRLGFLYGPGNRALLRRFLPLIARGRLFIIGGGDNRIATLYVGDAAEAVVLAGTHPAAANRIYDAASDERVTQRQYLAQTARALGFPAPARHVGPALALAAAALAECWARLRGAEPPFTRAMVRLLAADQVVDARRIRRELGWRPVVDFAAGMRRAAQWHAGRPGSLLAAAARDGLAGPARVTAPGAWGRGTGQRGVSPGPPGG